MAHVEVTREIARRFNSLYGEVFPIPEGIAGSVPTLVGTDGQRKMSKSLNNAIFLSDTPKNDEPLSGPLQEGLRASLDE